MRVLERKESAERGQEESGITIEGWKLNHTQHGLRSRVSSSSPRYRISPTFNAHACAACLLHQLQLNSISALH